jgi:cytidylate kinase
VIITLAGAIGSGKSTLAAALAAAVGAPRAGFGDYVRRLAADLGLDIGDRTVLQDLGHGRVEADAREFLDGALAWSGHQPGDDLVLDGLRHMKILAALQARAVELGDPMVLVYLDTPLDVRHARVASRRVSLAQMTADEQHPVEQDLVEALRGAADLVLPGDRPIETLLNEVMTFLAAE